MSQRTLWTVVDEDGKPDRGGGRITALLYPSRARAREVAALLNECGPRGLNNKRWYPTRCVLVLPGKKERA